MSSQCGQGLNEYLETHKYTQSCKTLFGLFDIQEYSRGRELTNYHAPNLIRKCRQVDSGPR